MEGIVYLEGKVYNDAKKLIGYRVILYKYDSPSYIGSYSRGLLYKEQFNNLVYQRNVVALNFKISRKMAKITFKNKEEELRYIASQVRRYYVGKYGTGTDLAGHCIEASEILCAIYTSLGLKAETVEGWCLFDNIYYGSDRPYDEHTWLMLGDHYYVDVTADQFNPGMYTENEFPGVIFMKGLPHGMQLAEPLEGVDY